MTGKIIMKEKITPYQTIGRRLYHWLFKYKPAAVMLILFLLGLCFSVIGAIQFEASRSRFIGVGAIFFMALMALSGNLFEARRKEHFWRRVATRTGLTCRVVGSWLGSSVHVVGTYRQRALTLYASKWVNGHVPATRIELSIANEMNASLRLRGPFKRDEAIFDQITSNLFTAIEARQFGHNQRFFIRSQPVHLMTGMFRAGPLQAKLLKLDALVNIELDGRVLYFEQLGPLRDVEYLQFLFELLSDLADMIERGSYVKLVPASTGSQ